MSEIIFDSSFESDKTKEYILSIQVSLDGFSFSVVNSLDKKLLAYKAVSLKISNETFLARRFKEWMGSVTLLQKEFKKINIIYETDKFTFVPEEFYDYDSKAEIINHLFEINGETDTAEINIAELSTRLIFSLPSELKIVFQTYFKDFELTHPVKNLIDNLPELDKKIRLVLFFNKHTFYALMFKEANLLFSNSFPIVHENDSVFYLLSLLKQLKVSRQSVDLFVSGNVTIDSKLYTDLQKYFSSVQFLKHKEPYLIDEIIFREPEISGFSILLF